MTTRLFLLARFPQSPVINTSNTYESRPEGKPSVSLVTITLCLLYAAAVLIPTITFFSTSKYTDDLGFLLFIGGTMHYGPRLAAILISFQTLLQIRATWLVDRRPESLSLLSLVPQTIFFLLFSGTWAVRLLSPFPPGQPKPYHGPPSAWGSFMYWWSVAEFWYGTTGWVVVNYALQAVGQLLLLIILSLAQWKEPALINGDSSGFVRKQSQVDERAPLLGH